jgi:hypothetical protein
MNLAALSDRERRLVAVAILLALLALLVRGIIVPIVAGFDRRSQAREQLELDYARNARIIASAGRITRIAERQKAELRAFILSAPTAAAAADTLQQRIEADIETVGGEFRSAEARPLADEQLRMRVDARLTLAQVTQVLAALQNRSPYVAIDGLTIAADSALVSSDAGPLDVRFDVTVPFLPAAA